MNSSNPFRNHSHGFTLIELMVTLSLVAIISMLAVPSFNQAIASSQLSSGTNELYAAMTQAKSEAVRRGKRVTVCASANGTSCSNDSDGWQTGWITFVDGTRTATVSLDSGEDVIAVGQALSGSLSIRGNISYFSFSADSRSRDMGGGFLAATVRVCSTANSLENSRRSRAITVTVSGRLNILSEANVASGCPAP